MSRGYFFVVVHGLLLLRVVYLPRSTGSRAGRPVVVAHGPSS